MSVKKRFLFGGSLGVLALALVAVGVFVAIQATAGGGGALATDPTIRQYAAKFICGAGPTGVQPDAPLAPGFYNTEINIHNAEDATVTIQKKAVAEKPPELIGDPFPRQTLTMSKDSVFQIDCQDIRTVLIPPGSVCPAPDPLTPNLCKGYVIIEAAKQTATGAFVSAQVDVTDVITVIRTDGTGSPELDFEFVTGKSVSYTVWPQ